MNQEKYFYLALKKYQQDQLEDYSPSPHQELSYSNSDHHHNGRLTQHKRTQSGYSILHDEHLYSKHSFYDVPASEKSYDPFRSSKNPIIPGQGRLQNVTIHRGSGSVGPILRPATALGHRTGSSLRAHALRNSKRSSAPSRGSSKRSTPSERKGSIHRSVSRSSTLR